jgi:hypothetical protein
MERNFIPSSHEGLLPLSQVTSECLAFLSLTSGEKYGRVIDAGGGESWSLVLLLQVADTTR